MGTLALLFLARVGHSYEFQGASSRRHPVYPACLELRREPRPPIFSSLGKVPTRSERAIPQHPNHLQVIIDIRYQYAIMGSLSRHDPSACPPQLWRSEAPILSGSQIPALSERGVPREPCSPVLPRASMGQVVLLASSESSHPTRLLSRQQSTTVSPLAATLMNPLVSVADKRLTAGLNPLNATLTKNRGWGVLWLTSHPGFNVQKLQRFNVPTLCGAPCYTVHPWLANASASISSPISTGAKKSPAPFASLRIPPRPSRRMTNTAGSKSAQDTAK